VTPLIANIAKIANIANIDGIGVYLISGHVDTLLTQFDANPGAAVI
jgi:hypothetical protein